MLHGQVKGSSLSPHPIEVFNRRQAGSKNGPPPKLFFANGLDSLERWYRIGHAANPCLTKVRKKCQIRFGLRWLLPVYAISVGVRRMREGSHLLVLAMSILVLALLPSFPAGAA